MPKSGTLTKAHIVEAVAKANGYSRNSSFEIVEILLERIKAALEFDDEVLISSFGKFCVRKKKERRGRNPATGKDLIIAPRKVVTFKWSGMLKNKLN